MKSQKSKESSPLDFSDYCSQMLGERKRVVLPSGFFRKNQALLLRLLRHSILLAIPLGYACYKMAGDSFEIIFITLPAMLLYVALTAAAVTLVGWIFFPKTISRIKVKVFLVLVWISSGLMLLGSLDDTNDRPDGESASELLRESELSYLDKVNLVESRIAEGDIVRINAEVVIPPGIIRGSLWADYLTKKLEASQMWWAGGNGDFHIYLYNFSTSRISSLGIRYSDKDCGRSEIYSSLILNLPKPVLPDEEVVISFNSSSLPLSIGKGNCLIISEVSS